MRIFTSALLIYMLVSSITPGPNNLTMLFLGARHGFKGTLKFMTGSMLTFLVKGSLCGLLNLALADIMPKAVVYLKWAGAAYMVYLGVNMALSGFKAEKAEKWQKRPGRPAKRLLPPRAASLLLLSPPTAPAFSFSCST